MRDEDSRFHLARENIVNVVASVLFKTIDIINIESRRVIDYGYLVIGTNRYAVLVQVTA